MFTIYHAVIFVAMLVLGFFIGYPLGRSDGFNEGVTEAYRTIRSKRNRTK